MLHSLSGFPFQISRGMIGCKFNYLIFFTYYLLKVVFNPHRVRYMTALTCALHVSIARCRRDTA